MVAMVFNFSLNNVLTYASEQLQGKRFFKGLLLYSLIATVGIAANVSAAQMSYQQFKLHTFFAALLGVLIDVIWRFTVSNRVVWRRHL